MNEDEYILYDSLILFYYPIEIKNDHDDIITIYGLLYEKQKKHDDDLWTWEINRYMSYLRGCQMVQEQGGKLAPDLWITPSGDMIPLNPHHKNFIYKTMRRNLEPYRMMEYNHRLDIYPGEHEDIYLTSYEPVYRMGIVYKDKSDKKKGDKK